MADKPTSAEAYLAKAKAQVAKEAQAHRIEVNAAAKAAGRKVPDLNPADKAVARMMDHAAHLKQYQDDIKHPSRNGDLRDRVARLENLLQLTLDALNAATITCSGGSVVLTLPSLPT